MIKKLKQEVIVSSVFVIVLLVMYILQDVGVTTILLMIGVILALVTMSILYYIESKKQTEV